MRLWMTASLVFALLASTGRCLERRFIPPPICPPGERFVGRSTLGTVVQWGNAALTLSILLLRTLLRSSRLLLRLSPVSALLVLQQSRHHPKSAVALSHLRLKDHGCCGAGICEANLRG